MTNSRVQGYWLVTIRWAARILGSLLAVLVLVIVISHAVSEEGLPNPFTQPLGVAFGFLGLFAAWLGVIIGWKWEGLGGLLVVGGIMIFHVVEGKFWLPPTFELFELAGLLFLAYWSLKRFQAKF